MDFLVLGCDRDISVPLLIRKVVYKYSMYSQLEKIYFDETNIHYVYDKQISRLKSAEIESNAYNAMEHFKYIGTLLKEHRIDFARDSRLLTGMSTYMYDNNYHILQCMDFLVLGCDRDISVPLLI
jgi:hypothetical protein